MCILSWFYHLYCLSDDTILLGPSKEEIDNLVRLLEQTFKIEDQGELSDYLVNQDREENRWNIGMDTTNPCTFNPERSKVGGRRTKEPTKDQNNTSK